MNLTIDWLSEIPGTTEWIEWDPWMTPLWMAILVASFIVGVGIKCLFIKYIIFDAQKGRAINLIILFDQVSCSLSCRRKIAIL